MVLNFALVGASAGFPKLFQTPLEKIKKAKAHSNKFSELSENFP